MEGIEQIGIDNASNDSVSLWLESGQPDNVAAGALVDICAGNSLNDIDGEPRQVLAEVSVQAALSSNIERQQAELNDGCSSTALVRSCSSAPAQTPLTCSRPPQHQKGSKLETRAAPKRSGSSLHLTTAAGMTTTKPREKSTEWSRENIRHIVVFGPWITLDLAHARTSATNSVARRHSREGISSSPVSPPRRQSDMPRFHPVNHLPVTACRP